jgi:PAS domain S-box-containing protein
MPPGFEARSQDDLSPMSLEALRREMERVVALASRDRGLLDAILNHSPTGVLVCDAVGRITLLNRAAERIWAGSAGAENMSEWDRYQAFHPDGRRYLPADWSMAKALRTGEAVSPEEVEIERFDGTRATILAGAAPILGGGGKVAGALGIFSEITEFKRRERELLARERAATARLARLQTLTAALSEAVSPADVAHVTLEYVIGAVPGRSAAVWVLGVGGAAELIASVGLTPEQRMGFGRIPPDAQTPVADVLRTGHSLWLASPQDLVARYPGVTEPQSAPAAVACLAMTVKGQCIGVTSFQFDADGDFGADERSFLLVAVRHAAQALERARLFDAEQHARAEAEATTARTAFLYEASTLLSSSLEYEATLASVARLAVPRIADWCAVDLAEDIRRGRGPVAVAHKDAAKVKAARELGRRYPPDPDAALGVANVLRTGVAELYEDIPDALLSRICRDEEHLRIVRQLGLRSAMLVPMSTRDHTLGTITFVATESGRRYRPADLDMAVHLGRRAALAIDNARLYEAAQQAVRAREEVTAIVSHDLKNPLNAILMSAGLIRRSEGDPERVQQHADAIERSVHRMRSLVHDLLDLARLDAGRFTLDRQPQAVAALASEAVALIQPLASGKTLALELDTSAAAGASVTCDRERVLQVFSNLLGNAVTHTPHGGRITVRAHTAGREVVLAVADTGPGIPAQEQRLVFDRFWKSRASRQGTGLGLSIAKGIVEAHGGRIWVESEPPGGAIFLFTLPVAPALALFPFPPSEVDGRSG